MIWQLIYQLGSVLRHIYWFIFHPDTFGVMVIIEQDNKYLFIRHGYGSKKWTFPGGGIKRNETPSDAARRETMEEVKLELFDLRPIGTFENYYEYKHDTVYCYHATTKAESKVKPRRGEILAFGWFPKDELPNDMAHAAMETLKMLV